MGHKARLDYLNVLINNESESDSDSSDEENVQTGYAEVPAIMHGHDGGYVRDIPSRFMEERDDRLMNSMVGAYAREVMNGDGSGSGHMFLNKEDARAASDEVIANHVAEDRNAGEEGRFEDTWAHFDVNHDGLIEAERMP